MKGFWPGDNFRIIADSKKGNYVVHLEEYEGTCAIKQVKENEKSIFSYRTTRKLLKR